MSVLQNSNLRFARSAIALCLLMNAALAGAAAPHVAITDEQVRSLGIEVQQPRAVSASAAASWTARVIPAPDAEWVVAAQASGVVLNVAVTEGQEIKAGTVLAEINSPDAPQLAAELLSAESAARLARKEWERDRQLHADGIIAARRAQATEQASERAHADLAAVQARLRLMGLSAQDARDGRLRLRAPAAGTILERRIVAGQALQASDTLFRIADTRRLWLELKVPVHSAAAFSPGTKLKVGDTLATVRALGSVASESAQTVSVRAELPAGIQTLRPGEWVAVQQSEVAVAQTWHVPAAALSRDQGQAYLFTRVTNGFSPVKVRVLASDASGATVSGALDRDMHVATSRTVALKGAWLGHGGE